jgi:hypothetical protein
MFRIGSTNSIAKRFESAGKSRIPGFTGIIVAIDKANQTVDLWRQGTAYVMRGVPYGASLRTKPEWVRVRSAVYVRYPDGNRCYPEVEGPAVSIPTTKAGSTSVPPIPGAMDTVISGCRVVQSSNPYANSSQSTCVVETGQVRIGGITHTFAPIKIGEAPAPKFVTLTPGVAKVGYLGSIGTSYTWVPLPSPPSVAGTFRYDQVEVTSSFLLEVRSGAESAVPIPLDPRSGQVVLGYILRRYNQKAVVDTDIQTTIQNTSGILQLTARVDKSDIAYGDSTPAVITVTVAEYNGSPINGQPLIAEILSGNGSLNPYTGSTNSSGICTFSYLRGNTSGDVSPILNFRSSSDPALNDQVAIVLRDVNGIPI